MLRRIAVLAAVSLVSLPALAASPVLITHAGRLLDASDAPVTGAVSVKVTLYGSKDGIDAGWNETYSVSPFQGAYSIVLGDTSGGKKALTTDDVAGDKWLGVNVNGTDLTPRLQLGTVPYAAHASEADHAQKADDAAALGGVPAEEYALKSDVPSIAADSRKLGGVDAGDYALKTDLSTDAQTLETHPASYFLAANAQAADSAKLGGVDASDYALKNQISTDAQTLQLHPASYFLAANAQAADSAKLGGVDASAYAQKSQISTDAQTLQNHDASYFLAANAQAADSAKLGGIAAALFVKTDADANDNVTLPGTLTLGGNEIDGSYRHIISYTPSGQTAAIQISTDGIICGFTAPTEGLFAATLPSGGNVYGARAAKVKCESTCGSPYAHMCSVEEATRSGQIGAISPGQHGWIDTGVFAAMAGSANYYGRDCLGWTNNTGNPEQGMEIESDNNAPGNTQRIWPDNEWCSTPEPIACCK